jgi:outer membrane protein OmpA-like peptidoglycan-associated protein
VKARKLHRFVPLALAVVMVSPPLLAGCAALAGRTAPATSQVLHRSPPVQLAIAQVRHGANAPFDLCPIDACPKPTPKTLAGRDEALAAPMPLAAASSPTPPSVRSLSPASIAPVSPAPLQPVHETPQVSPTAIKTIVVTFASGSALLTASAQRQLAVILPDARRARVIEIRGRTDELGSAALNEVLARNRALAVRDYLRAQNLPEVTTVRLSFKGACCYVAGNDTVEGRAANRRVEIEWQLGLQLAQRTTHERN